MTDEEHDRLVERLRAGLDEFTSSVRRDPPGLDEPTTIATGSLDGGAGRARWTTGAAAAIFTVAAVGAIVWVAGGDESPTAAPPTQPPPTAVTAEDDIGTMADAVDPLIVDVEARRDFPEALVTGRVVLEGDCVLLDAERRYAPVWPAGTTWDTATRSVVLDDGTAIPVGATIEAGGGYGSAARIRGRDDMLDVPGSIEAVGRADCVPWQMSNPDDNLAYALSSIEVVSGPTGAASGTVPPSTPTPPAGQPSPSTTIDADDLVTVTATVLQSPDHGPQLCGAVAASYPPQCGGADIVGWSWAAVEGEESANGTIWGEYVLVGTYSADGTEFRLVHPVAPAPDGAGPPEQPLGGDPFATPCAAPDGGWDSPYPRRQLDETAVRRQVKEFGGLWIDEATGVYNVRVVGDQDARAAAEAAIGRIYPGPACIVEATHTLRQLTRIQNQVTRVDDAHVLAVGADVLTGKVLVSLTDAAPELEDELTAQHGDAIAFEYSAQPVSTPSATTG